jgi:hypothetical protein
VWQVTLRLIIINKSTNGQRLKDSIYYFLSSNLLPSIPILIYRPAKCDHPWTNYVWWSLLWTIRVFFLISHYQTGFFLKHWIAKNGGNTNLSKIQRTTGRRNQSNNQIKDAALRRNTTRKWINTNRNTDRIFLSVNYSEFY